MKIIAHVTLMGHGTIQVLLGGKCKYSHVRVAELLYMGKLVVMTWFSLVSESNWKDIQELCNG